MSKTVELARHLEKLHINNMYKTDFYWTWDKTDDEIDAVFTVADALRDLREHGFDVRPFAVPGLDISSSALRRRVYAGRTIRYLVPEAVRKIIEEESLYRRETDGGRVA